MVREAFASPYGRSLIAEIATALRAAADPECLKTKNLSGDQLVTRGEELVTTWGIRAAEKVRSYVDLKVYEKELAASAGRNAEAELNRLRESAQVKHYLALERPVRLAKILDFVIEQFDRYVLLNRIKLARISPLATGKADLLIPAEQAEEALDKLVRDNKDATLRRFLELAGKSGTAMTKSIKPEAARASPATYVGGIESDLAAMCIPGSK